jgi:uncharacterized membrane protein
MHHDAQRTGGAVGLSTGLGLFSLALGAAELAAPQQLARAIGLRDDPRTLTLMRIFGAREVAAGLAILYQPHNSAWLWSRVGGDLLDLAALGSAMSSDDQDRSRLMAAASAVLGVTALDVLCARQLQQGNGHRMRAQPTIEAVTIRKPADELYRAWRRFSQLPRFMRMYDTVEELDATTSRWTARGPGGMRVTWESELTEDREGSLIAWRSRPGSAVATTGRVTFTPAPANRGTEVRVTLTWEPPGGGLGKGLAWLTGSAPGQHLRDDLRRFKQLMETGEVTLSDGPALWRPAQPAADPDEIRHYAGVER